MQPDYPFINPAIAIWQGSYPTNIGQRSRLRELLYSGIVAIPCAALSIMGDNILAIIAFSLVILCGVISYDAIWSKNQSVQLYDLAVINGQLQARFGRVESLIAKRELVVQLIPWECIQTIELIKVEEDSAPDFFVKVVLAPGTMPLLKDGMQLSVVGDPLPQEVMATRLCEKLRDHKGADLAVPAKANLTNER